MGSFARSGGAPAGRSASTRAAPSSRLPRISSAVRLYEPRAPLTGKSTEELEYERFCTFAPRVTPYEKKSRRARPLLPQEEEPTSPLPPVEHALADKI